MKSSVVRNIKRVNTDTKDGVPPSTFTPEHSLPHAFSVVANRISHMLERMYGELYGISVVDWRIIAILGTHFPLSAKALSELTAMDQVSVSRAIEQLTNKKLVLRRTDAADRRRVALRLSKNGLAIYNHVMPLLFASEAMLVSELSDEDAGSVRRIMEDLVERSGHLFGIDKDWRAVFSPPEA
ncbi:MAG: transcriptional regulator, MarR family protein [Sphingomonadales bacterium]|nr:transcriptional regulator, MarR family protein [Sphingomonadales bacterium]